MEITLLDRSNYFRGLLILIGKDRQISDEEKTMFKLLGKEIGFNKEFYESALDELLENEFIIEEPPKFSNVEIAKIFIRDGIKLAFADKELHIYELSWLKSVADINSVDPTWGLEQFEQFKNQKESSKEFEIIKLLNNGALKETS